MYKLSIISTSNKSLVEDVANVLFEDIHTITSKYNYSPFLFQNNKRNAENSTPQNIVCFDVDDGMNLNEAIEICQHFKSIVITSKSHKKDKKGLVADRFRIIIPIDKNIPKEYFKTFYELLSQYLGFNTIDKSCNDLARFFYPNNSQEVHYSTSSSIISFDEVMSHYEPVDTPKRDYQVQTYTYSKDLKSNELDSNFVFKDGSRFCDYENISVGETIPIRCFNPHHEDKHPSAFIGRSATSQKLMVSCSSCNDTKFISYESERENISTHSPLNTKTNELINKSNTDIIANSGAKVAEKIGINSFDKFQMTKKRREELKNMKYVIDGLIVENYHTYLMGNAGAGKTTITLHLCFEMVQNGYKVIYLYLDGALNTASKVSAEIERLNIEDNFKLLVDGTMNDYKEILQTFINTKTNLDKVVFVLDTFKFLSADINHKNANKEAMHLIKEVCKLGATFISLGHTNKDGVKFSGTAEIEQDSDGVLKIDGYEDNNTTTSTIKKGGRCRYEVKEVSYKFERGDVMSVTKLNDVFDAESKIKELELLEEDKHFIIDIKSALRLKPNMLQKDILMVINEMGISKQKGIKLLNRYNDKHWKRTQSKEALNGYEYKVIDTDFDKLVENLKNNLNKTNNEDVTSSLMVETKENDLSLFGA